MPRPPDEPVRGSAGPERRVLAARHLAASLGGMPSLLLVGGLGLLCLLFALATEDFATEATLRTVLLSGAWLAVLAVGTSLALAAGAIDFSIMANVALTGLVAAKLAATHPTLGILAGLGVGALVGLANSVFVVGLGVNPFLGTLAMLGALRGIDLMIGDGTVGISVTDSFLGDVLLRDAAGVPYAFLIVTVVTVVAVWAMGYTVFGRRLIAVGGNAEAARLAGIRPRRVQTYGYLISGVAAGCAGILLASRLGAGVPLAGNGQELTLFSAVLIGGTSLWGGRANVLGSLLAVLLLTTLYSGLVLSGHSEYWQGIVSGCLLIVSVWLVQRETGRSLSLRDLIALARERSRTVREEVAGRG